MPFLFKKKDATDLPIQAIATQNGGAPAIPTIDFGFSRFAQSQNTRPLPPQTQGSAAPPSAPITETVYSPPPSTDYLNGNTPQHPYEQAYIPLPEIEQEDPPGHPPEYGYASTKTQPATKQDWDAVDWMNPSSSPLSTPDDFEDPLPYTAFNDPLPLIPMEPISFAHDPFEVQDEDHFTPLADEEELPNWGEALTDFQPVSASKNSGVEFSSWESIPEPAPAAYPMPMGVAPQLNEDFASLDSPVTEPIVDITVPQKGVSDPFSAPLPVFEKEEDFWSHAAPGFDDEDVQALSESLSPVSSDSLLTGPGSPEYAGELHDKVGLDYYPSQSPITPLSNPFDETDPEQATQQTELADTVPEKQLPHPAPFETLSQNLNSENPVSEAVLAAGAIAGTTLAGLESAPSVVEVQPAALPATGLEALCDPSQLSVQEIMILSPQRVLFLGRLNTGHSALFGLGGDRISMLHRFDHNLLSDVPSEPLVFNHSLEGAASGKEMYLVQINRWKAVISASEQGFTLHTLLSV